MNLKWIDWIIIVVFASFVFFSVWQTKRFVRSVADFLAANRSAGRYLLTVSQGLCMVGAVSIISFWQQNYTAGFSMRWWEFFMSIVVLIVAASGWVTYRYRQTRCMTMAQFFELRYSRKFRIFAGLLAVFAGVVNYGIFPSVEAQFFQIFCGFPKELILLESPTIAIPVYPLIVFTLLATSILFVFMGGQIAVVITDFLQGLFVSISMVFIVAYVLCWVGWQPIVDLLSNTESDKSLINPFETGGIEVFNFWFFFINVCIVIYNKLSWQGTLGFNACAKSAHEAKMGEVLSTWRSIPYAMLYLVIPIAAHAIISYGNYPTPQEEAPPIAIEQSSFNECTETKQRFENVQRNVQQTYEKEKVDPEAIRSNLLVTPMVLVNILPSGLKGLLIAIMIAAALSTHASYLHSWGSIFIQDVFIPIHGKPLEPKKHMNVLKMSILAVSLFAFFFSVFFPANKAIQPLMMITGAIFCGGAGAVIIGGLYWKKGTTLAAWIALISGSLSSCLFILIPKYWAQIGLLFGKEWDVFPINDNWLTLFSMILGAGAYFIVSLLQNQNFNMDKLLHRGEYAIEEETIIVNKNPGFWKFLGMGKEFTKTDKIIYLITYFWNFGWMFFAIIVTIYYFIFGISDETWLDFWLYFIWINLGISVIISIWFSCGGIYDLIAMIKSLKNAKRDDSDDGFVR